MADPTAAVALDALSGESGASAVNEKRMFDFFADVKATAIANGTSAQYANPAALGGEALRSMGGYLKQTARVQEMLNSKKDVRVTSAESADEAQEAKPALHAGPAKEQLSTTGRAEGGVSSPTVATIEDLSLLADRYTEIMKFSVMTSVVTGGASIAGHAVTSLTKGQ
jgi:hypothetical protein